MARKIAAIKPMIATITPPAKPGPKYACDAVGTKTIIKQKNHLFITGTLS